MPLADDVDLDAVASATAGMVGAELANLINEAALQAARRDHTAVQQADFSDALDRPRLRQESLAWLGRSWRAMVRSTNCFCSTKSGNASYSPRSRKQTNRRRNWRTKPRARSKR